MNDYQKILDYWFDGNKFRKFWFKKNNETDNYIKMKFGGLLQEAEKCDLNVWKDNPLSFFSLIIILDQFSRNIYRNNTEQIIKNDKLCLTLCREIIEKGFDNKLTFSQKIFLLLPFRHSKDLYNIYYCIQKIILYKKKEIMDKDKTILFNKFLIASIKDLKNNLMIKKFICYI